MPTQKWYTSKTIWAGIIGTVRGIYLVLQIGLPVFGITLPPIPPTVDAILGTVLGATTVHGRYTADATIEKIG